MNTHAQALGRLGGLANKGKPKSEAHKLALRKVLEGTRKPLEAPKPAERRLVAEPFIGSLNSIPEPKTRRCQAMGCSKQGREVLIWGVKAWMCESCAVR